MLFILTVVVGAFNYINGIGYIKKLYTVPEKYEKSDYYRTEAVRKEIVKKNQRERLTAAWQLMQSVMNMQKDSEDGKSRENVHRNRNGKKGRERNKKHMNQMRNNYNREMERLQEVEIDPKDSAVQYQNNQELTKELLTMKEEAYNSREKKTIPARRFQEGDMTVEYSDDRIGIVLVTGNILDAGGTEEGLENVQKTVTQIVKNGKRRRIDNTDDADDADGSETEKCFEDILRADTGDEEMWIASTHVDLSRKRRKKERRSFLFTSVL